MTPTTFRKAALTRDAASTLAGGLRRYVSSQFGETLTHAQALGVLAQMGGYVNVHEMSASFAPKSGHKAPLEPSVDARSDILPAIAHAGREGNLPPVLAAYLVEHPETARAFSLDCWLLVGRIIASSSAFASVKALAAAIGEQVADAIAGWEGERCLDHFHGEIQALVQAIRNDESERLSHIAFPGTKPYYMLLGMDRTFALVAAVGSAKEARNVLRAYQTLTVHLRRPGDTRLNTLATAGVKMVRAKAADHGWSLDEPVRDAAAAYRPGADPEDAVIHAFLDSAVGTADGGNLIVALDISGGIPHDAIERMVFRLNRVVTHRHMTAPTILFDTAVLDSGRPLQDVLSRPLPSGGGTIVGCIAAELPKLATGRDALMVVTDGYLSDGFIEFPITTAYGILKEADFPVGNGDYPNTRLLSI